MHKLTRGKRILCVCAVGTNRSRYLASYLKKKGYSTKFGGVDYREEGYYNPLKQEDVDWANTIIITRKRLKPIFDKKFKFKNKRVIVLDVTDSKRLIPEKLAHLRDLDFETFQKKWTRPQLRKAIKKYLQNTKGYFIILRGPLGIGKTTVAKELVKILKAGYVSIDKVLEKYKLDRVKGSKGIPLKNFIKGDKIVIQKVKNKLKRSKIIIIDGCFYHKEQIKNLIENLPFPYYVFTLKASLKTCIERDRERKEAYGIDATNAVYKMVSKFDYGEVIDTENKNVNKTVNKILSYLPNDL
ncbi:MAG: AAA family ATPase [Candidatus Woesearchaeota archaeon]